MQARVGEQQKRHRERERHKESEMHGQRETAKRKEDRCGKRARVNGKETGKRWMKPSVQAHKCASLRMCNAGHAGMWRVSTQCVSVWACKYLHVRECEWIRVHL